tara:strand:- start:100 stop:579 length:480 start_codon:yes stop_codon:yes gene_type:complete
MLHQRRHICRICNKEKAISEFYINNTHRKTPTVDACKFCKKSQLQERYAKTNRSFLQRKLTHSKRSNRHGDIPIKIDVEFLLKLLKKQKGLCALSHRPMTRIIGLNKKCNTNISIDRINSDKGYIIKNVQLVCADVNVAKNDLKQKEFIKLCKLISKNN